MEPVHRRVSPGSIVAETSERLEQIVHHSPDDSFKFRVVWAVRLTGNRKRAAHFVYRNDPSGLAGCQ